MKYETGGVDNMCQISEEIRRDAMYESSEEIAIKMLQKNTYSIEEIADITSLTVDEVKALAEKKVV